EGLAEMANVSLSTIQRIEKNAVQPRSFTLKTLATALELDFAALIAVEETAPASVTDRSEHQFPALKRMVLLGMLGSLIPLCNIIFPLVFRKRKKKLLSDSFAAGSILSFQILWTIAVVLSFFLVDFIIYLFTGLEGYRPVPVEFFIYLFFVALNLGISLKQVSKLNATNQKIFSFVPNFF
ncbi:MAG: helix-turn-helix transcriptional regulator, partial [Flavobacteriaceae bacterium]|nr:helix-turn-helix transcriptional regulator [Flavobacteriaceae bacterium]